ncbi:hypothetical protein BUALT_Bualt02G0119300 [Buddleja alternifolia]|uniref:Jacalin-type lectin domain-containing protein n=1 Tax=Buddleja alternifolia TaxID=168488 RepID=A0AAV6Y0U4_9LAMI|nr:hypothetical protein BUALT_Bualt02G0119300 [Buddleja alternifolia]
MVHLESEKSLKSSTVGPWGGPGGNPWDDGTYDGVRVITLRYSPTGCIDSMQVIYDKHNKPFSAPKHGGTGGPDTAQIVLRFPEEILTKVTGYYSALPGYVDTPVIRSLTFWTNMGAYGPYGPEQGTNFSVSLEDEKIVGFIGRSGGYLDAIGFHLARAKKI